jgi:hypothetical protein
MPKISEHQLHELVVREQYYVFPGTTMTICCLTLKNGFNVIGKSACVHQSDFDAELGMEYAHKDAIDKIWELEGYKALENIWDNLID